MTKARAVMEDRDSLLKRRSDLAHWFISKHQRLASYQFVATSLACNVKKGLISALASKNWTILYTSALHRR